MQCSVVGTRFRALRHHLAIDRAQDGAATAIRYCHDDLGGARDVEHDAVDLRALGGDLHEVACA